MQAYGRAFARVYNKSWATFANQVAPLIEQFYAGTEIGRQNRSVLDLCCGCGHLAAHFLQKGYTLTGIDLSEHMLQYARENTDNFVASGQARFIQADASDFTLDGSFGLVVSTFDSMNHLSDEQALTSCFRCVHSVCDGYFVFDLNTRRGLRRWNSMKVDEFSEDFLIITRGIYDGEGDKAWTRITGFIREDSGLFERFDETVYNTVFKLRGVEEALREVGFKSIHFARFRELENPIPDPEELGHIFVVAGK